MSCLIWSPAINNDYEKFVLEMEQSFVKLRIAEKEERIRKEKERKLIKPNSNNKMSSQQKDGKYFLVRLEMEIQRINEMIDAAEKDARLSQLPDEVCGRIRTAVGKAQLLLSKRFKQFEALCNDNIENDPDKKETKASDLQGYWDMMFIQVEDVNSLFVDIQKMKDNNWEVCDEEIVDGKLKGTPNGTASPKGRRKSPNSKSPTGKSPRTKKNNVDDEKVKREARNRLAAARKQAKLRAQQEAANGSLNSSLNSSWTVETPTEETQSSAKPDQLDDSTCTNGDDSLNTSSATTPEKTSMTSSNSSSAELLIQSCEDDDSANKCQNLQPISPVVVEVNGVA